MIMLAVNERGIPLSVVVESASTHEGHVAEKTIDGIHVKRHGDRRCKRHRRLPLRVVADKGYDDDGLRDRFAQRGIDFISPYRENRDNRPHEDRRKLRRWKVERSNSWLKNFRRVTTRYDRSIVAYRGFVRIACICITLMRF